MEFSCTMCVNVTKYHKDFCSHFARVHKNDPLFLVYCQIGNCSFSTQIWNSYKQHISKQHKNVVLDALNNDNNEDVYNDNDTNPAIFNAVYLLSLETRHNFSQSAVNAVAENTSELIQRHL